MTRPPAADPLITWFGDGCLRVEFAAEPPTIALARVHSAFATLRARPVPGLSDLTPAYRTLLLTFDAATLEHERAESQVRDSLREAVEQSVGVGGREVQVPACYDPAFAPDLDPLCRELGMTPEQLAHAHAGAAYTVAFIGFSPGFPYLVGLPERLHAPRHPSPRVRVEPGSIGIAGDQCGIYPQATPGGWRIIARTPLRLFDATGPIPAMLEPGDVVRFAPITAAKFHELAAVERKGG
ncbi:MAG: 5-oxoprolinase subunit PxpB [Phycisphaerales bacterium]